MLIILPSITTAMRVQRMLASRGIGSELVHSTKNSKIPQCGHGLKISPNDLDAVKNAVKKAGSKIKAVVEI